ncbi:MAG: hypothetical protein IKZ59_00470 [Clostridia bacterium]|nr:hypothetical protein [Clostridia bacterium]
MKNDLNFCEAANVNSSFNSIIKISDGDPEKEEVISFLRKNMIFAGYILPNIINYGFDTDFFECFYAKNSSGNISFVATRYYNSSQVFCESDNPLIASDFANTVKKKGIKRISGNSEFMRRLKACFNGGVLEEGTVVILDNSKPDAQTLPPCTQANTIEEFQSIAALLMEDKSFAANYSVDLLSKQFYERSRSKNGRNYYISDGDGTVLCHVGTYAECDDLAVISGLKTRNGYFGHGYATALMSSIKKTLVQEGKSIILYFYNPEHYSFFEQFGFLRVRKCAKIELF